MREVACDLCGRDDPVELFAPRRDRGPIVRCRSCGLVYQNPRNEMPLDWSEAYSPEEEAFYQAQYLHEQHAKRATADECFALLERFLPDKGRLVEVGSASGFYLDVARGRGWDVAGIEPHTPVAKWSQHELDLDIHIGTLDDAPWPQGSVDSVALYNTLEHLESPKAGLRQVADLLRPGGVVAIQVPKIDNPWVRILGGRWRHFIRYHYYFFSSATMGRYFDEVGIDLIDVRTAPKTATLSFVAQRLWELGYVPRAIGERLEHGLERVKLAKRPIHFDLRDDLLVHGRKRPSP